ncbi:MAG: TetR/AcrR family transcriptional regulator [Deltaproteobacteria bacterium]|nr:TetR/AcrR family transcriptional regulator [Deltaproteobacteria bacterium]MBW1953213.1 TetR/AcrR family transcriptional regulator [Deltaproteobacteria bacterium]MBW1985672.1 TetR/AcrR family transcriptional regulator [Deltaproteobacteria bacterium]MBW2134585.1 TetR/AcrR family transcriptional regulator [Deltaproteobacteria bacterium]
MKFPKNASKKQVLGEFRTVAIIAAAKQVIAAKGFAATTMDEIAEAAQIAKGTIYLYFKSKDDLFQAVIFSIMKNLVAQVQEIRASFRPPREKIHQILKVMLENLEAEQAFFRVYVSEFPCLLPRPADGTTTVIDLDQDFVAAIAAVLAEGMQTGDFISQEPRKVAYVLRGMTRALAIHKMVEPSSQSLLESLPLLSNLVLQGLAPTLEKPESGHQRPK